MKFWMNKEYDDAIDPGWEDSYIFSLKRDSEGIIYTNLYLTWYRMDQLEIADVYEDLFVIAVTVFAIDKRLPRKQFKNAWTRDISVSIPVIKTDEWNNTVEIWNRMLNFLTGDNWDVSFRTSEKKYSRGKHKNRIHLDAIKCDCVCLFSGGMDSFCGAIKLLEEGKSPCLIGHNEYPKLRERQSKLSNEFQSIYSKQNVRFVSFTANSRAPQNVEKIPLSGNENTSRSRSLLFLSAAISVAGILGNDVPVFMPENGFLGLNVPLTYSRQGTCSTRTTHPYFIKMFSDILKMVNINNPIYNFYAFMSKKDIVRSVSDTEAFKRCYEETISCSHPCQSRYIKGGKGKYPANCGYCYPCLIREASLFDLPLDQNNHTQHDLPYDFLQNNEGSLKILDLKALCSSLYRYHNISGQELERLIKNTGKLSGEEIEKYKKVYCDSMKDIEKFLCCDKRMKEYIGI